MKGKAKHEKNNKIKTNEEFWIEESAKMQLDHLKNLEIEDNFMIALTVSGPIIFIVLLLVGLKAGNII